MAYLKVRTDHCRNRHSSHHRRIPQLRSGRLVCLRFSHDPCLLPVVMGESIQVPSSEMVLPCIRLLIRAGQSGLRYVQSGYFERLPYLIPEVAVAKNSTTLIAGRAVTGVGGAGVLGGVYVIVAYVVSPPKQAAYLGLTGAVFSIASVAGPLLGGVLTDTISWRWWCVIFLTWQI